MKSSVVLLAVAGVVAALAAAVLMGTLSARRSGDAANAKTTLLVADRDLPALTVVTESAVRRQEVTRRELPAGGLTNAVQVVGQLLIVPMKQGQAFTAACFAGKSPGQQLLKALPPGKRAMSVSLANYNALSGLLYPGAVVDVLTTYSPGGRDSGEIGSKVLLSAVQVLAIEDETVGAESKDSADKSRTGRSSSGRQVTLMVDSDQARALQVAMEHGSISLALRNPQELASAQAEASSRPSNHASPAGSKQAPFNAERNWEIEILRGSDSSAVSVPWPTQKPSSADDEGKATAVEAPPVGGS